MSYSLVLLCLCIFICQTTGFLESWTSGHSICRVETTRTMTTMTTEAQVRADRVTCSDTGYIEYVQTELASLSESSFRRSLLESISNLYKDLETARLPNMMRIDDRLVKVFPVSLCIPEEFIGRTVPPKQKPFGRVIPGDEATYFPLLEESKYREDMAQSLFTLTYKKGGWDCLRHTEILASGSLPLFVDIAQSPNQTLSAHPKELYKLLLNYPGLQMVSSRRDRMTMQFERLEFDHNNLDKKLFMATVSAMLQYTRNVLSTKAMASFVLETISKEQAAATIISSSSSSSSSSPSITLTHSY